MKSSLVTVAGSGTVLDISSGGVAFKTEETLHRRMKIKLSISWPVLLQGKTRIMLVADGTVVRTDSQIVGVKVARFAFRTQKAD